MPASETKPVELRVPAELYDKALAFCNARLREQGKSEITELPAGFRADPQSCPCGAATGMMIYFYCWFGNEGHKASEHPMFPPRQFIQFWDVAALPDVLTLPIRDPSLAVPQ